MKLLGFLLFVSTFLFARDSTICKTCHPSIYKEYQSSMHKRSTLKYDKVHAAVWKKHPANKDGNYQCAKCHSPQKNSGVDCYACHTIVDIKEHPKSNTNIYETHPKLLYSAEKSKRDKRVVYKEKSSFFGLFKKSEGSPYHDIDYTNKNFYTAKVCMGCHSHKKNSLGFDLCKTGESGAKDENQNCITCHMLQVEGSATTIRESKTHAFHGFAGLRNNPEFLSKYINISFDKKDDTFSVKIQNTAPHDLLIHPLRVLELRVFVNDKELERKRFQKVLGSDKKPAPPWLATSFIKNNMIKAGETREINYPVKLKNSDEVEIVLGYYVIDQNSAKKLGLKEEKDLSDFKVLKKEYIKVK